MRPSHWLAALVLASPAGAVTLDWSPVQLPLGVPNPPDTAIMVDGSTGYGSVPYAYEIALFEVTNAQYAEFLSAVAASDPHHGYDLRMGSDEAVGGITRSGDPGSRRYATKPGFESKPVVYVTFYDALRFANWLHNEQPVGSQGPATTEDGAYTLALDDVDSDGDEFDEDFVVRNAGARVFLTSEDEWYKAAYYDRGVGGCYDYPAGSGRQPECKRPTPPSTYDAANCGAHGTGAGRRPHGRRRLRLLAGTLLHLRPGRERRGVERGVRRAELRRLLRPRPAGRQLVRGPRGARRRVAAPLETRDRKREPRVPRRARRARARPGMAARDGRAPPDRAESPAGALPGRDRLEARRRRRR